MTKREFILITRGYIPTAHTAVEALSKAEKLDWGFVRKRLIDAAHALSLMPTDQAVVERLMADFGYVRQPIKIGRSSACVVRNYMNENYQTHGIRAIVKIKGLSKSGGGTMVPLLPHLAKGPGCIQYTYRRDTPISASLRVDDIYIHSDGGGDHILARRRGDGRKKVLAAPPPTDTEYFHYHQANPGEKATGDCLIRALAAATGMTWDEVLDGLAKCAGQSVLLNIHRIFEPYLRQLGFQKHRLTPQSDGHWPTGAQLCEKMGQRYHDGERIVALIGRAHMTAILPVQTPPGPRYKIVDTFDCSDWVIDEYWVRTERE